MKKIFFLMLCFSFLFILGSCGEETAIPVPTDPLTEEPVTNTPTVEPTEPTTEKTPTPEQDGLCVYMPENKKLKVLQLADIHFGIEGKDWHNDKVDRTKEYINSLITEEKPDFIVCSGDNILGTGTNGLIQFIEMMESYKIPWTWVYGNHDAENFNKASLSETLVKTKTEYLLYEHGYMEPGTENRFGNFSIKVYNHTKDKLLGAFIILDSGEHNYSIGEYQAITPGQIEWYKNEIDSLQAIYATQENNEYDIIPTVVYTHIQLPEYYTAYTNAQAGTEDAEFVIKQDLSSSGIAEIKSGGPKKNTGFFDVLVEKGSTKAYFVGHAHTFYFQVKYKGIILGFGPQTGFSKLFENNEAPRKTYLYTYSEDLTFETKTCNEIVKHTGLFYTTANSSGNANYIRETGCYTFVIEMKLWSRVILDYYGDELTTEYTPLTFNNTTITGEIKTTPGADWSTKLYFEDPDVSKFFCSKKDATLFYRFTYDPVNNTLDIQIVEDYVPTEGELAVGAVNKNSDLTVWKNKGFNVKSLKSWCSNTAEAFIVVDAEGRIAYAVMRPTDGNGDPTTETYYVNPYYTTDRDYTTNPAIVISDSGYKIIVPEGGFAISAKGQELANLLSLILDPAIKSSADLVNVSFTPGVFKDNLRLSFDAEKKIIKTIFI